MRRYWSVLLLAVGMLLGVSPTLAKGPPDKAVISGPGIAGEIAITDAAALSDMGLGALEDFERPLDAPSQTGSGYQIDRFFRNGETFQPFDRVVYYPPAQGERGRIFYAGMAVVGYGSSEYDGKWFQATAAGDAAVQRLLGRVLPQPRLPAAGGVSAQAALATLLVGLLLLVGAGHLLVGRPAFLRGRGQQPEPSGTPGASTGVSSVSDPAAKRDRARA